MTEYAHGDGSVSWWGKVLGGTLGFMLGNVPGAVLGVVLGHLLDDEGRGLNWDASGPRDPAEVQRSFFAATFQVMGHLCKADGRVSEDEIALARQVMGQMRLTPQQEREAIRLFEEGKAADFPVDEVITRLAGLTRGRRDLVRVFVEIQMHAALADGAVGEREREILGAICRVLRVSPIELAQIETLIRMQRGMGAGAGARSDPSQAAGTSLEEAYQVLGVSASVSDAEVKKAYRRLMNEHHPDKLVAKGLPESMMKVAQERSAQIRRAYERIKEHRGFK